MKQTSTVFIFLLFLSLPTWGQPTFSADPIYRLYVIGDAGEPGPNPTLDLLKKMLDEESITAGVIFLGDNIYSRGMPAQGDKSRAEAEEAINGQINAVKNFHGDIFFIPGNHDWGNGREHGWDNLKREEAYIEAALDSADVFLPTGGCPGPVEISLSNKLTLVIFDTQYFLQKGDKPDESSSCGAKSREEAFAELEDILDRNVLKKVIIASHHPMFSKGMHGGVVTWKDHIFPLTKINPSLYIPLPVIGSIFPLYRQIIGSPQDIANLQYKSLVKTQDYLYRKYSNITHISGHEHALQHLQRKGVNYVVSGAGSKQNTTVKQKRPSKFAGNYHGFGYIDFFENGQEWLTFVSPDVQKRVIYKGLLDSKPFLKTVEDSLTKTYKLPQGNQLMNASDLYEGGKGRKIFFGEGYRKEWFEEVRAPVFDIGKEMGGLKIIKKGGRNQTTSLRLEASNGKQYVLRLLDKDPTRMIPEAYRSHFVERVVQEGIAGSNPYAAFTVPPLAEATGVYHTNPKLVFIPEDPRFGIYQKTFSNQLALFEERPAHNQSDADYFGNARHVISTPDMLQKLYKDNDNRVDQEWTLDARLLDMIIGDWDRHDDQWRWAELNPKGKGKLYRPIPRDRDQVYYISQGIIPGFLGMSFVVPPLQGFDPKIKDVPGLWWFKVRFFDRSFLTELTREQWRVHAASMQQNLTDKVIEQAVHLMPPEVYDFHGEDIIRKLKLRRDDLIKYAEIYYETLAKEVEVVGSNKQEYFLVERLTPEQTRVTMYKLTKAGQHNKILYQRLFYRKETKEIRLYGLGGEDIFNIVGKAKKGIKVRIIGGGGYDRIKDESSVSSFLNKTIVYDTKNENDIAPGSTTRVKTSNNPEVNKYNREAFIYNYLGPIISIKSNKDDGLFIGGGVHITTHAFRKSPFQADHKISINNALATASYNFKYEGIYNDVVGKADIELRGEIRSPNYVTNFFGIGNESVYDQSLGIDYYRVRFNQGLLDLKFRFNLGKNVDFKIGPSYQTIEVRNTAGRFISNFPGNGLNQSGLFDRKEWLGFKSDFVVDTRNRMLKPETGILWSNSLEWYGSLRSNAEEYGNFQTAFSFYYSFRLPSRVTLSNRTGLAQTFGTPEFYQLNYLGSEDRLRGYRKFRFAGERTVYNNTQIDIKLIRVRTYIIPTQIGMSLFNDLARASVENDNTDKWHHGYGFGIWLAPTRLLLIELQYGHSEEGWFPAFAFGFSVN